MPVPRWNPLPLLILRETKNGGDQCHHNYRYRIGKPAMILNWGWLLHFDPRLELPVVSSLLRAGVFNLSFMYSRLPEISSGRKFIKNNSSWVLHLHQSVFRITLSSFHSFVQCPMKWFHFWDYKTPDGFWSVPGKTLPCFGSCIITAHTGVSKRINTEMQVIEVLSAVTGGHISHINIAVLKIGADFIGSRHRND